MTTLSRLPTDEEIARVEKLLHALEHAQAYADVFWMLLNSAEFRLNH
jgi:hypothetical protein